MKASSASEKRLHPRRGLGRPSRKQPNDGGGPAIVLVKPQLGENIGFAARAMANFGLSDLRLVAPRDGWPNDKAHAAAAGAAFVVEQASVYASVEEAIGALHYVIATTARPRELIKPVLAPESAAIATARFEGRARRRSVRP